MAYLWAKSRCRSENGNQRLRVIDLKQQKDKPTYFN